MEDKSKDELTAKEKDKQTDQAGSGVCHGAFIIDQSTKTCSKQGPKLHRISVDHVHVHHTGYALI